MTEQKIQEILHFWYGDYFEDEFPPRLVCDKWYSFKPDVDKYIRDHFQADVERALAGEYDHWAVTGRGRLALLLLLDQFTRHIYRHTPQAFSGDKQAMALVTTPLHKTLDSDFIMCEKMFYYAPLEHSELLAHQAEHKKMYDELVQVLPENIVAKLRYYIRWFTVHYDVVVAYGRFPWRNDILGRESTPEEVEFMKNPPDFGQRKQVDTFD